VRLVEDAEGSVPRIDELGGALHDAAEDRGQVEIGADRHDGLEELSHPARIRTSGHPRNAIPHALGAPCRRAEHNGAVTIRVFLLDDHELVRRGVRELLESEQDMEVVGEAGTAEEALSRIPPTQPDVAVLDMRLPDGDGIEVCRDIRAKRPEIACIILTSFADDDAVYAAIMAGAAGYVLKQVRGAELVEGIRHVARGESLLDPAVTTRVLERLRNQPEDELAGLTEQERRILDLIAEGLTNRQIGERLFLAEKTVKNYVSNLLAKLGMSRRTEAAVYAARLAERRNRENRP
jgi:DNA-binding NarL/FixJ family response regulator